jgi:hypothetical protein
MPYILAVVGVAVAVVLLIFTGIWGGLLWIVAAAITLAVVFMGGGRTVTRERTEPTGTPRASRDGVETANERVGQP